MLTSNSRKYSKHDIQYLSNKELQAFFESIKAPRDKLIFAFIYYYGLRASELVNINCRDIDIVENTILIKANKNGITGHYYLFDQIREPLLEYISWRKVQNSKSESLFLSRLKSKLTRYQIFKLYKNYAIQAGLPEEKQHPHCLRHTIAVHMASGGADLSHVQMHLRHRAISSTLVYFRLVDEAKRAIQKQLAASKSVQQVF